MLARLVAVAFVATLSTAAYAQSAPPTAGSPSDASAQTLPQEIRNKLKQDGFTDIKIVPGSFLVSAQDKNGDPVNMVIGPHSMMMLTEVTPNNGSQMNSGRSASGGGVNNEESGSNSNSK